MKQILPHLSFRVKLSVMMITIVTLTLFTAAGYQLWYAKHTHEAQKLAVVAQHNLLLAEKAKNILKAKDSNAANQLAQSQAVRISVDEVAVIQENKTILGYYARTKGLPLPEIQFQKPLIKTTDHILYTLPIVENSETLGYLYINYNTNELFPVDQVYLIFVFCLLLVMTLVSILVAGRFQTLLTSPILKMVRHIEDIYRSGNFEKRLSRKYDDEIGRLIQSFNQILDTVQSRENELTTQSKQLKRLVEVRTEQLYQKAHFDSLTGLPNRYLLVDRLHQAISKSTRSKSTLALLFLDLDRFKIINDNLGHQNGDQLLKEVAKRLTKVSRDGDTVARLGGDEFVFLLENLGSPKDAARTANRIIDCLRPPFRIQEHILHMSTSIGISIFPQDGEDDKILLKNADISMYHAKEKGPGNFSFYTKEMNQTSLERLEIESNLRSAIENNELYLDYQPQKRLKENRFRNVEALIRWRSPKLGLISPGVFIPIAEETGLINQIDLWVISEACKQIKIWENIGLDELTVAINISAGHLISDSLLEHLKEEVALNQIDPGKIEIEITEAVFITHSERTIETLKAIKAFGAKIAIDDFGTGYSSLQYIQNFPADTLKLDGMFVQSLDSNSASKGIVRSTVILAHSLGLELVAEGVETQEQLDYLTELECDLIQGFLLSKPVRPQEIPNICN